MGYNFAYTTPIPRNLSKAQVWEGLKFQARDPQRFGLHVTWCRILSESPKGLVRELEFNGHREVEAIEFAEPSLVRDIL